MVSARLMGSTDFIPINVRPAELEESFMKRQWLLTELLSLEVSIKLDNLVSTHMSLELFELLPLHWSLEQVSL